MSSVLVKHTLDVETFAFEYAQRAEILAGQTLTGTPTVTCTPAGPAIGTPSIVGSQVRFTIGLGGVDGTRYKLTCQVSTNAGVATTLEAIGYLDVSDR